MNDVLKENTNHQESGNIKSDDSHSLYNLANEAKKREYENKLVDVYQISLYYLDLTDPRKSYTINLVVEDNEIIDRGGLINNPALQKAEIINEELYIWDPKMYVYVPGEINEVDGKIRIILLDKFIMTCMIDTEYKVTITVNKMKSHPKKYGQTERVGDDYTLV